MKIFRKKISRTFHSYRMELYRKYLKMVLFITLCFLFQSCAFVYIKGFPSFSEEIKEIVIEESTEKTKNKILIIDIKNTITQNSQESFLYSEPSTVSYVKDCLMTAKDDDDIKGIILAVNSPGGGITATDLVYRELKLFREATGKKVYVLIEDLGTSGAYYIAMAGDYIFAQPTSVVGSIGVIMLMPNISKLSEKIGISATAIKSGDKKDMGSPFRDLTDDEKKIFQSMIDEYYNRFLDIILENRKNISREKLLKIADGRVSTAREFKENNLVDEIGYFYNVYVALIKSLNIKTANIIKYKFPFEKDVNNIYSKLNASDRDVNFIKIDVQDIFLKKLQPQFMYLWLP